MALRTLVLQKQLREKNAALEAAKKRAAELLVREKSLEDDIANAATKEEQAAVDSAIEEFDNEQAENATTTTTLEAEIAEIEGQIAEAERNQSAGATATPPASDNRASNNTAFEQRRVSDMPNMSHRERTIQSLQNKEVRTFYEDLAKIMKTRATGGVSSIGSTELTIPEIVMNRIRDRMGDYATVANEVETISVGGTSRVVLDGADPEAIWVEMSGAIEEVETSFKKVELDGFKLAGYMIIPNDIIDDAFINLAEYVEKKLAKAIAKSRDKAILKGTGATGKQMVGIIPNLADANKPAAIDFDLGEILSKIALVDDGEESYGEIIGTMKRSTFYARFVKKLITVDSAGRYVVPNLAHPNIGVRVVFSQYMEPGEVLFGDFKRYLMAERSGVKLDKSTDVRFFEDQTAIKGLQRMDGKPIHVDADGKTKDWVLVTINDDGTVTPPVTPPATGDET